MQDKFCWSRENQWTKIGLSLWNCKMGLVNMPWISPICRICRLGTSNLEKIWVSPHRSMYVWPNAKDAQILGWWATSFVWEVSPSGGKSHWLLHFSGGYPQWQSHTIARREGKCRTPKTICNTYMITCLEIGFTNRPYSFKILNLGTTFSSLLNALLHCIVD